MNKRKDNTLCGIIGYVGNRSAASVLIKGLKTLEYRGYDSFGLALTDETGIIDTKTSVGAIGEARVEMTTSANIGMGHTRWATHGGVTEENAHPQSCSCHSDSINIAVVHNGILTNYLELKKQLLEKGHHFSSETDTECIPHMIQAELDDDERIDFIEALKRTVAKLKGSFAFVVMYGKEPNKLYFAKNKSPLVVGLNDDENFVSSAEVGFLAYTRRYIALRDMTFGYITKDDVVLYRVENEEPIEYDVKTSKWNIEAAKKGGYPHFMLKELHEQPDTIQNTLEYSSGEELEKLLKMVDEAKEIFIVGSGTSYHSCYSGEILMVQIANLKTRSIHPGYLEQLPIDSNTLVIAVSQSGETADVISALNYVKSKGAKVASLVNNVGTQIPRMSSVTLYTQAGPEIGVAATKTFTCQVAALTKIALEYARYTEYVTNEEYEDIKKELNEIPTVVKNILRRNEFKCKQIGERIRYMPSAYFLGSPTTLPIALEGALKIKEIAYIHAEAYSAAESKHGPIALIDEGFPVFFCIPSDMTKEHILGNIQEMKARGAHVIGVNPSLDDFRVIVDESIEYPALTYEFLHFIPQAVILQVISYYAAAGKIVKGTPINPDKPRNLAKSVTVQ